MSQARILPAVLPVQSRPLALADAVSIPRALWVMTGGMILALVGGTWDFAWHMSIGRDTMWIPPHVMVQVGGILVGIASAYVILTTTWGGSAAARDASVNVLGLRGPGGAFIALWGSVAIFASEPFDNWWHNAYGLDVKMITPPHSLLFLGSLAAKVGAMAWIASAMSQSMDTLRGRLRWLFLFVGSLGLIQFAKLIVVATLTENMHTAACYLAVAVFIPPILFATGRAAVNKWGCTIAAAIYTAIGLGSEWLLPLFPAQPKLGPVYHNVTHLIPIGFPLLLIVPAFVADVLLQKLEQRSSWFKAICVGPAFLLSFLAVQWPFANFLMSPASRNWVFGTAYFAYGDPAGFLYDPYKFAVAEKTAAAFLLTLAAALVAAIVTTRLGLAWGNWMRRVRR
ncbi:MAG TPA: hypothetical protein VFQ41_21155 [Candidatus Angelobacter sp.]|nr:hypothetical protein [Candidatus Angelobacter sp.]